MSRRLNVASLAAAVAVSLQQSSRGPSVDEMQRELQMRDQPLPPIAAAQPPAERHVSRQVRRRIERKGG